MRFRTFLITAALLMVSVTIMMAQGKVRSAKASAYAQAYHEQDSAKANQLCEQFLKDYPIATTNYEQDKAEGIQYYRIYITLITRTRTPIDEKIKEYYDVLTYYTVAELYYRQVALANSNKIKPAAELMPRSFLLMRKLASFKNNKPQELKDKTDEEWHEIFDRTYFGDLLNHVNILRKAGNIKEGLLAADEAIAHFGYLHAMLNEDDVLLLQAAGLKDKMQKALEASVNVNQATPAMLDLLKKNYLAQNKDEKGFDAYVESLKSEASKESLEKELAASMIKSQMPAFTLYDGNGKLVDTKQWKGKVVVLDFFASWCVPCKAAFPGMKMAQEKFAGDEDVLFYFVDNQEHANTEYKAGVMKYIKDNNFPFNILFDDEGDKGLTNRVSKLMHVSAIPRKFVLDKNGQIRFDMMGYYGSPTKLADEIKIMVNLAKQQTN